ncbi:MAG TPA: glycosyltransferase family 87 protein [Stellaceae bacterium]|nr:glycosyltransferase family 87 protein [Stellaceae bacterium]
MALPLAAPRPPQSRHWLTEDRIRVYSWIMVAVFGIGFAAMIVRSLPDLVDPQGKPFGYDFMAFWSAARLALAGHPTAVFDGAALSAVQHAAVPAQPAIWFPWHYPPTYLLAVLPLGLVPYPVALAAFMAGTTLLWLAFVRRLLPDPRAWVVAAAAPAGLLNLLDGQNAFLTAALAGFAVLWLDRKPRRAGVLIGLLAIKPHLAVLLPVALVAGGYWRSIAAAAATVVIFLALSVAVLGTGTMIGFVDHLAVSQAMADRGAVPWQWMPSPYVLALSLRAPASVAALAQAVAALGAGVCVWRAWRTPAAPFEAKAAVLFAASMLVSPYMFTYDLVWDVAAIGFLAVLGLRAGFRRGERDILFAVWLAPLAFIPLYWLSGVQFGCLTTVALLAAAVRRAVPAKAARAACGPTSPA